jgi:hypothetical protein
MNLKGFKGQTDLSEDSGMPPRLVGSEEPSPLTRNRDDLYEGEPRPHSGYSQFKLQLAPSQTRGNWFGATDTD